jgi:large subunit ribosomal protein L5
MAETKKTTAVKAKAPKKVVVAEKAAETVSEPAPKKVVVAKKAAETASEPAPKAEKVKGAGNKISKYVSRVETNYKENVIPAMMKEFNYSSVMQVPHLEKIVINMGVGEAAANTKEIEDAVADLTAIAGQHPLTTYAKKAIANFKIREGQAIGCKVTLRGIRMFDFYDKLISVALPRVRDFRGLSKNSFDTRGNYALGIKEQIIFPEIDFDKISHLRGMDIIIVTTANTDKEAYALLKYMGLPFRK